MRVFFAVFPNKTVQKQVAHHAQTLEPICGGRKIKMPHLHLTLVFLGEVSAERIEILRQIMKNIPVKKFELVLDQISYWKRNQIVSLQGKQLPAELFALVEAIQMKLAENGFSFDQRAYKPHITLLRQAVHQISSDLINPIRWPVNQWSLVLSKSVPTGVEYAPLHHWRLK
ncbi:MAG: RNA 2',3'-cyclic phosphodiesterase [Gammaproteobacteria bacterium]|nr:MAG: RNA 2',3'-cyclic phosphodiesterase [Gammaproteobacteria bacterium]